MYYQILLLKDFMLIGRSASALTNVAYLSKVFLSSVRRGTVFGQRSDRYEAYNFVRLLGVHQFLPFQFTALNF